MKNGSVQKLNGGDRVRWMVVSVTDEFEIVNTVDGPAELYVKVRRPAETHNSWANSYFAKVEHIEFVRAGKKAEVS